MVAVRVESHWRLEPVLILIFEVSVVFLASFSLAAMVLRAAVGGGDWALPVATGVFHLAVLGLVGRFLRRQGVGWREAFGLFTPGWRRAWPWVALLTLPVLGATLVVHQASLWTLGFFGAPLEAQAAVEAVRQSSRAWERALLFVFAVVTAPVVEELLFRGVLWSLVRRRGWRIGGCVGVSLVFAGFHGNVAVLVPLWMLGAFWTWLYERTGDLTAPILSHALFNAANFIWLLVAPTGSME